MDLEHVSVENSHFSKDYFPIEQKESISPPKAANGSKAAPSRIIAYYASIDMWLKIATFRLLQTPDYRTKLCRNRCFPHRGFVQYLALLGPSKKKIDLGCLQVRKTESYFIKSKGKLSI